MDKTDERIIQVDFGDEFKKSYIDYSMSVIVARAIPDARDGLKPVQRRVLYDMSELGINYDKATKKSARIVGDTMGKYHPHGDSSIYETLVVMSQDFKRRNPLVNGYGNFGSIEGDGAAAQRYTEAKLEKFTQDILLTDLDKTITYVQNYDGTETEPEVLPARLPMLLINGSEGIAVGMVTSTPQHNVTDVCNLCLAYLKKPDMTTKEMLQILNGPDFPTGGIVANKDELESIYETGNGKLKIRGKVSFESGRGRGDKDKLVITEIPYTMVGNGIEKFLMDVSNLVDDKTLPEITDISNQSSKEGIRIVLELKSGSDVERVKNILYRKTKLEDTFGVNMLVIKDKRPEVFNLKKIMATWIHFQNEILTKKYSFLLKKEEERYEIESGLIQASNQIDLIIEIIRGANSRQAVKDCLVNGDISHITLKKKASQMQAKKLSFTDRQAEAILKMQLQKLIGLEVDQLEKEAEMTLKKIGEYKGILSNETKLTSIIRKDIQSYLKEYGSQRRTLLMNCSEPVFEEKETETEYYFVMDRFKYCKLIDPVIFEKSKEAYEKEYPYIQKTTSLSKVLLFTDSGILHYVKCKDVPVRKFKEKGEPVENISNMGQPDMVIALFDECKVPDKYIFVTEKGFTKVVPAAELKTTKRSIVCSKLTEDDKIIAVLPYSTEKYLITYSDSFYRIPISDIPTQKRTTVGLKRGNHNKPIIFACLGDAKDMVSYGEEEVKVSSIKSKKLQKNKNNT
ncbi:DNA topoisomerase [Hungatella hathewayi]|uniref:DNA gyrase subunit A n=1 Tax=Hungatella hathewayi TaxID=154046 RepID=UPI000E432E33|nr:DNA gyrase subunit A [Hungatella hathewayi]RGO68144.1 DNA topoisomerase [Hungatella hathewayi]